MNKETLRVTLLQTSLVWEDKAANLSNLEQQIKGLKDRSDLVVLPEMCTTGFSMQSGALAEPMTGVTIMRLLTLAQECGLALAGSFICAEEGNCYNRAFLITPEGDSMYYDKRHLFRMGGEDRYFAPGTSRPVFNYKGWNIVLQVCYDLRFPVWSRNHSCEYDLALYVANWPASRIQVWDILLPARAIENQSYVCGVNRVGEDGAGLHYNGHSCLYSAKGEALTSFVEDEEGLTTVAIDKESLYRFREKFPVWKDAD